MRKRRDERAAIGVRVERFAGLIDEAVRRAGVSEAILAGAAHERVLEQALPDVAALLAEGLARRGRDRSGHYDRSTQTVFVLR